LLGGNSLGVNSVCGANACAAVGACCFGNAPCQSISATACATAGGSYAGPGTMCATACAAIGACCLGTAPCPQSSATACEALYGAFLGAGLSCCQCVPAGTCCLPTGCTAISQISCTNLGGTYGGDGTTWGPTPCHLTGACCFGNGTCQVT